MGEENIEGRERYLKKELIIYIYMSASECVL